jgi:hypothetical protein
MKKLGIMMILAVTTGAYMALSAGSDIVIVDPTNRVQQCGPVKLTNPTNQFTGYTGTFQIIYATNIVATNLPTATNGLPVGSFYRIGSNIFVHGF